MKRMLDVTTPSDREIVMVREFDAPRRLVWDAMTKPELIRRWIYAPNGWQMTVCEGGMNVGDSFRWSWNDADGKPAMTIWGENLDVVPQQRVVHTEHMEIGDGISLGQLLATIELTEAGESTTLRMTLLFPSKEARDGALASGMERGVAAGYETLDGILGSQL
ncbi:MAG: SRPBCC domain-containing protein [Planctomycetaceae bacterium]